MPALHPSAAGTRRALVRGLAGAGLTALLVGLPVGLLAGPASAEPGGPAAPASDVAHDVTAEKGPDKGEGTPPSPEPGEGVDPTTPVPRDLAVTLRGPATGTGGGTGAWTIGVANQGDGAAAGVRLALELPAGLEVTSVQPADGWACVLKPFSCTSEQPLPGGESASDVGVTIAYAPDVDGSYELAALAYQGEGAGAAMRIDRGAAAVALTPKPAPPAPKPVTPTPPAPQPEAPQPAAPQPAAPQPAAPQPAAPKPAAPAAPAPADEPDAPAQQVVAAAEPTPAALPFADDDGVEETADESTDDVTRELAAPASAEDDGGSVLPLVVLGLLVLLVAGGAAAYVARGRSTA